MTFALLIAILGVSFALTYLTRILTLRKSILDTPNERSSHIIPTPRGGGLAIVVSFYSGLVYYYLNNTIATNLFFALASGLPLVMVSILDDVITIKPRIRLVVQSFTILSALYFLGGLQIIELGILQLTLKILLTTLSFFGLLWFINLYNFIDGIDGYATTQAIFAGLVIYFLTSQPVALLLLASALGFLPWNWQRARIFMGDVGSTFIGFVLGVLAIYLQNTQQLALPLWLILVSLFWYDASLTLFRRWRNNEKLSVAHRKHAYQRIVQSGFSHQKTVLFGIGINAILAGFALAGWNFQWLILPGLVLSIVLLHLVVRVIDRRLPFV